MRFRLTTFLIAVMLPLAIYGQDQIVRNPGGGSKPPAARLTVNGSSRAAGVTFPVTGGRQTLSVSTNQGTVSVANMPDWITQSGVSNTSIVIECGVNPSENPREGKFTVKAGGKSVIVSVSQAASKMGVVDMRFANVDGNGNVVNDYGSRLFASEVRYLKPRLIYNGPATPKARILYVKFLDPDGNHLRSESSPAGYSFKQNATFNPGQLNTIDLSAWGSSSSGSFAPGLYRVEVYSDGVRMYSGAVNLCRRSSESTYLRINNQNIVNSRFYSDGGVRTFDLSTDCDEWRITEIPSFCELTETDPYSFTVKVRPNQGSARSGQIIVSSDNQTARVNVNQEAGSGVKINRIWTDFNSVRNGQNGMVIHIDFEAQGLKDHSIGANAYFEYSDGRELKDIDGNYGTSDGQVAVSALTTANYDNSRWNDFELFIPLSQLHVTGKGTVSLRYQLQIHDRSAGALVGSSEYINFTLTQ